MFQITVEKLTNKEGKNYPDREEIYVQVVDEINLLAIINAVNKKD